MAHYLVRARPKSERLRELERELARDAYIDLRPFGREINDVLKRARVEPDGVSVWEEEDYCSPPLAQERAAVLDEYFEGIEGEPVTRGEGWARIDELAPLFPELAATR